MRSLLWFLIENRIDFLKKMHNSIDTSHDHYAIHRDSSKIINHFAQHADPSTNKLISKNTECFNRGYVKNSLNCCIQRQTV